METWSRIGSFGLAFVGGVIVVAVMSPVAQADLGIGGVFVPWGLILGLATLTAYLAGLRLINTSRWLAICGAIGAVVTDIVLVLPGPGGGILIPGNLKGELWAFLPAIIAVVVIAFPRLRRSVDSKRTPTP